MINTSFRKLAHADGHHMYILTFLSFLSRSVSRREADQKLHAALGKQGKMERQVREADNSMQRFEDDLRLMTKERDETAQEMRKLEVCYITT